MSRSDRRPPKVDNMFSLKVDNLAYRTTSEKLRRVFGKYGEIGDVYIPKDPYTHDSRGFAFVRYYDDRDADDAIRKMDGRQIDGREIRVQMARFGRPTNSGKSNRRYSRSPRRRGGRDRSYSRSPDSYRDKSPRDRYDSRRQSRSRSDDY